MEKILQYYRQDDMKSYRILQYPRVSYIIVKDPMELGVEISMKLKDSTALCKILNMQWNHTTSHRISKGPKQNPIKSLLILVSILWDLRQDFERLNSSLSILPMES